MPDKTQKKLTEKEAKELFERLVRPENRMAQDDMDKFDVTGSHKPIVEFVVGESQPIWMCVRDIDWPEVPKRANLMYTIIFDMRRNTLQGRGRIRYEDTGHKTSFNSEALPNTEETIQLLKNKFNETVEMLLKTTPFGPVEDLKTAVEITFPDKLTHDQFVTLMEGTGRFNVGMVSGDQILKQVKEKNLPTA